MHYLLRAGASEVSRGSLPLADGIELDGQVFWSANFDFTDDGATHVLPTYTLDVWVTGADGSGNPFDSEDNTEAEPFASFGFIRTGPFLDLQDSNTTMTWTNPSPAPKEIVELQVHGSNEIPLIGDLQFILEQKVGDRWVEVAVRNTTVKGESEMHIVLQYQVSEDAEGTIEFRVREFDGNFELGRRSTTPLSISDEVIRDGEALATQVGNSGLSVMLYLIALGCAIYGIWMMVLYRESVREDEGGELDQTMDVMADLGDGKTVPELTSTSPPPPNMQAPLPSAIPPLPNMGAPLPAAAQPPPLQNPIELTTLETDSSRIAPVPEEGLPPGWTDGQWEHYGWTWLQQQGRA